jgi:iron complex outermembrane recepter protein
VNYPTVGLAWARIAGMRPGAVPARLRWAALILSTASLGFAEAGSAIPDYKRLSLSELMDLEVVSVSRRPEKFSEAASAIQVITNDDIRRSGATSLPEALRLASNLNVAQKGSQGWAISARGFNTELGNKMLVMIDGRAVYSPLMSGVFWDVHDYVLADIERIEVVSGPGATLWGSNAVNGVINIITKSAADTSGLYAETAVGTELENLTSLRYGMKLSPNVHLRLYGKFVERDGGAFPDGSEAPTDWQSRRGGFRLDATPDPSNTLTFQGDIYDNDQDTASRETTVHNGGNLLGRWTHAFEDDSEMVLQFYYDRANLSQYIPSSMAPAGRFQDSLDTYDFDFQHRLSPGERHQVVWGFGYRRTRDVADNAPGIAFLPAEVEQDLYSGFLQDEILLGAGWSVTLGTKFAHNDYTGLEFEPSVRTEWQISPRHAVWAAVSRAVRMPSRIDRDLRVPATTPFLDGGPGFESETVIAYEAGYRARIGSQVLVSTAVFYNRYDDIRSVGPAPGGTLPLQIQNNVEGHTHGLEIDSTYEVSPAWRLRAGYALLVESIRVKPGRIDTNNGLSEVADPRNQFSLRSSWDLPKRFELDAGVRWVDELRVNRGGTPAYVPSYWELDVRLAWRPAENLEISMVGQNLLHDQHREYGAPSPTREEVERSLYAKVAWQF